MKEVVIGNFKVRTADAAAQSKMTPEQARAAARAVAGRQLSRAPVAHVGKVTDRPIATDDLQEAASAFAPAATEVRTSASTFRLTISEPRDLWVFIFHAENVAMDDWGISERVVETKIVFNDKTRQVETAAIGPYNPDAR